MKPERRLRPVGLRREAVILLPLAFLLLVVLSVFTLFSYRSGIALLVEERQAEALHLARRVASIAVDEVPGESELRQAAPSARGAAVVDAEGRTLVRTGTLPGGGLLGPLGGASPSGGERAFGPGGGAGDAVAAFAPVPGAGRWVRVDLGAPALALQRQGLQVLTWLVLGVDLALVVLLVLFVGRMLEPYDALLEQARRAGQVPPDTEDEVAFLLSTFERALVALASPEEPPQEEAIDVLQRTLAASFESGVLLLDRAGAVLALNAEGARLLEVGRPEPGAPGAEGARPLEDVLGPYPELRRLLSAAVAGAAGVRRREVEVSTPSGRALTLGLTVHPLRPDGGAAAREDATPAVSGPGGYLVLFVDLTEVRRQAEQTRLAESLRQIGELAAGVAHELRNSLASVKGYLTLIERAEGAEDRGPGGRRVREYLEEIRHESEHLQRVLEDFLSFARPGTARLEEVDLHQVLARAANDPVLAGAEVRLAPPPPGGLRLSGDPQLLERAFRNLLHNAVQASRDGASGAGGGTGPATVEVSASAAGEALEVTVADRGPGIPEEVRERLFHPFASGRPGGVGLGLALARRILVLHGGRLEIEDRPGGGSLARATLPADQIVTDGNGSGGGDPGREAPPTRGGRRHPLEE